MATTAHHPASVPERLIVSAIHATWVLWLLGALYAVGPLLGWLLGGIAALGAYGGRAAFRPHPVLLLWGGAMLAMLPVLWIGHANFDLGAAKTLKSTVGWAKGWALLALFPLAAASLPVREAPVVRALNRVALHTLLLLPILLAAPMLGLPGTLWVSPLKVIGGSGPEYFSATIYSIDPGSGRPRWQFFAPWSPAAGMVGVMLALLALRDPSRGWRVIGVAGGVAMALLSQSRLALAALLFLGPMAVFVRHVAAPRTWFLIAGAVLLAGFAALPILDGAAQLVGDLQAARADSTRVRSALGRIAIDRWQAEAFWFGHGIVENGPHYVEYMPIGSHHSWYGLLFVKGLVGAVLLALPLAATLVILFARASGGGETRAALAVAVLLLLYSFGENLEVLGYLVWPGLVLLGVALRRPPRGATPPRTGGARR
ncbi:O-antigen ligase domain-containing protein [Sphingomicrobium astaxanthinifaciens]|uniref:O-antigen ligase domain-containing protein n=1 Tax=Sphingomicrobium astaxanthinifaciens TaxID=1227949 RepID=UPI001FCC1816|nr:O-antigen ligase domain-containing protein [Sphingomicrobium astaxanthinifaciens]MCJ7420509.1 O-antigen ligase domain-containing protein [Sphingomicrobium astaxanthinifaciens]